MVNSLEIRAARPAEYAAAFRLIFRHLGPDDREARTANAILLVDQGEFDPAGLFVAEEGGRLRGAMISLPVPGAAGLAWPPGAAEGPQQATVEDGLVRHASAWLRGRRAKVVQVLLPPSDSHLAAPLKRNGFAHVTNLWFVRHNLGRLPVPRQCRLEIQSYRFGRPELFEKTLMQSYKGSLDCPEVNGVRDAGEILAGHKAQGTFEPDRWLLAFDKGQPVGVLFLTELQEFSGWDLSYLGVVPEARRRGVGRELTTLALRMARDAGAAQLTLSVDARNRPAWDLYVSLGFEPFDQREVYLAIWKPDGPH
jgi:ribosomal protein S18 acetylase RimI-like enzyme